MKTFDYISRPYVNPVDLNVLGKTFDTLEEGHLKSIEAESDLRAAIAALPMNQAEDGYKQQLLSDIQTLIDNNTVYGNSYAALDDLIKYKGKLAANPQVLGRIKTQAEYQKFHDAVDSRNDLPQDYKDTFHELNPYTYEDKFDDDGNIIGAKEWKPTISPTAVVNASDLLVKAINIAAKEEGGGSSVRYLDANGNITTDPSKSYYGEYLDKVTSRWVRLPQEKIWKALQTVIDTTNGAKESLAQDYMVANHIHDKKVKENELKGITTPLIDETTDSNGIKLTQEQFTRNRFAGGVEAAVINNVTSTMDIGSARSAYQAAVVAQQQRVAAEQERVSDMLLGTAPSNPIKVSVNLAAEYNANMESAKDYMFDFINTKFYSSVPIELYKAIKENDIQKAINIISKTNSLSADDIIMFNNYADIYDENRKNIDMLTKNMNTDDKAKYDCAARLASGGKIVAGSTEWDNKIVEANNKFWGNNGVTAEIYVSPKTCSAIKNMLNGGKYDGYKNLGIDIDSSNGLIRINKSDMTNLPLLSSIIQEGERIANLGFWGSVYEIGGERYNFKIYDSNGDLIKRSAEIKQMLVSSLFDTFDSSNAFRELGNIYNEAQEFTNKANVKYGVDTNLTFSLLTTGTNYGNMYLAEQLNKGNINSSEYNTYSKEYEDALKYSIADYDFTQNEMFEIKDGVYTRVVDSGDRMKNGNLIQQALRDNKLIYQSASASGLKDKNGNPSTGYVFSIQGKEDAETVKFYVPNVRNDNVTDLVKNNPLVRAATNTALVSATKSSRVLSNSNNNPGFGDITQTGLGANTSIVEWYGTQIPMRDADVAELENALNNYKVIKYKVMSGDYNLERVNSALGPVCKTLSDKLGVDTNTVANMILQDLKLQ